jgi:hypothetical protein
VEQPTESDTSFSRVTPGSPSTLIHCYGCEDILLGWRHGLDARWLAFWLEREVYVVPWQTAFGFVPRTNVICPTCREHEEHFVTVGCRLFVQLCFPAGFIPRILLQNRAHSWNCGRIFSLQDLIGDSAAQHVAGDVPSQAVEGEQNQTGDDQGNRNIHSFGHRSVYSVIIRTVHPKFPSLTPQSA